MKLLSRFSMFFASLGCLFGILHYWYVLRGPSLCPVCPAITRIGGVSSASILLFLAPLNACLYALLGIIWSWLAHLLIRLAED